MKCYNNSILISILLLFFTAGVSFALDSEQLEDMVESTVLVLPIDQPEPYNGWQPTSSGSGTVIDNEEGLILTNFHVVATDTSMRYAHPYAVICVTFSPDQYPEPTFMAEFVNGDPKEDLTLLKITKPLSDKIKMRDIFSYNWEEPNYWKSAEDLRLNDDLIIIGYPDYGQGTVTITKGSVSGFFNDDQSINFPRAWIKTDANVSYGNSGGTAIDNEGRFIGVPTQLRKGQGALETKISLLRALDLADDMIDDYRKDPSARNTSYFRSQSQSQQPSGGAKPSGLVISGITFATGVESNGNPVNPGTSFPEGQTKALYAIYQHQGFKQGYSFTNIWYLNGEKISESTDSWNFNEDGTSWNILEKTDKGPLPSGTYTFEFFVQGNRVARSEAVIGASAAPQGGIGCSGRIVSADSGRGITGAVFLLLQPGVRIQDFLQQQRDDMVFVGAKTDRMGNFVLPKILQPGVSYPVMVGAEGYQPILSQGGLQVDRNQRSAIQLGTIRLSR